MPRPPVPSRAQRLPRLLFGLVLFGVGVAVMILADLGLGPWDVLHQGVSTRTGIPIGMVNIVVSLGLLVLWIPLGERPGIGTLANATVIGVVMDLVLAFATAPTAMWARVVLLLLGPILIGIGSGFYLGVGLGPGPRDGLMTGLARRGWPIAVARTTIELTALAIGWALGGRVGVGTVLFATTIGPLVHLTLPRLRLPDVPPRRAPGMGAAR